jgi:hypothetical protein
MPVDTRTLIWLFPAAFMLHDFEELAFGEPWLRKNAARIRAAMKGRVPASFERRVSAVLDKTAAELAMPIGIIFSLAVLSAVLAAEFHRYDFFLAAAGLFFLHGFMHIGQAILVRGYVPAVITSAAVAIPYGGLVFSRLIREGTVDPLRLIVCFFAAAFLGIPFILVMQAVGDFLYRPAAKILIR